MPEGRNHPSARNGVGEQEEALGINFNRAGFTISA